MAVSHQNGKFLLGGIMLNISKDEETSLLERKILTFSQCVDFNFKTDTIDRLSYKERFVIK